MFFGTGFSQIKKVNIDVYGDFEVVIKVEDGSVTISAFGEVVDVELNGNVGYNMSGKINSVGGTSIKYNMSKKVSAIGNISIGYNMSGKISSVGSISIGYNMSGKISSVERTSIKYNMSGKVSSIGGNSIRYNMSGKISSGNRMIVNNGITFSLKGGY